MSRVQPVNDLDDLVGEEISAIAFVRDYVELHFDGPILRALSDPIIRTDGRDFVFPESGSRDALCSLIGLPVRSVSLVWDPERDSSDERIGIVTTLATVIIPLDQLSRVGPEAALLVPTNPDGTLRVGGMWIW
jgi:hypothetical protein